MSIIMVRMWMDQFRQIPPTDVNAYPVEAQIAWKILLSKTRR